MRKDFPGILMMGNGRKTKNTKTRTIPYCDYLVNMSSQVLINGARVADNMPISIVPE